jgi:small-conductance mechanosensitive channel
MSNRPHFWHPTIPLALAALAAGLALPGSALAQMAMDPDAANTVTTLAQMVRWGGVAASIVVIGCAWLLLRFLTELVDRLGEAFAEYRLLFQKISAFVHFGIYFTTILLTIVLSFKISRDVLAILGGTTAVAIGFAMKDLVSSLVAGVMIMFDRPFQVGDRVEFGGEYGDIISIGLRSVKLRTLSDNIVTIPNNMFLNQTTSSGNYGEVNMQVVVDFLIGVDQDADRARAIAREAAVTSRYVYLPKPVVVRVSQQVVGDYLALQIRLKAYVLDTQYEKAFVTDVTLRIMEAFAAEGIKPPAILHRSVDPPQAPPLEALGAST